MRVTYLHQYFNTPGMSGSTRSFEMARRLVEKGHEVHIVTADCKGITPVSQGWYRTIEAGINVHWAKIQYSNQMDYSRRIRAFVSFAWCSAVKAAELKADVVFATSTPLTIAIPAVYAARRNRCPMVFEVRDLWPSVPIALGAIRGRIPIAFSRHLERFAYRNASRIVVLSPRMRDWVVSCGYSGSRVTVIPNGCDLELFDTAPEAGFNLRREYEWLGNRPLVVYTGTIGLVNGAEYLAYLAAAVGQVDPEVCFVLIGSGNRESEVRRIAADLGVLSKNLFILPSVPKREIADWLSAATIATSVVVNMEILQADAANKFYDALAAGRPIAINYGGWQANLINEMGVGLVLDPEDIESASASLVRFLRDKSGLEKAGNAARQLAWERFNRYELANQLEQVLYEAIAGEP